MDTKEKVQSLITKWEKETKVQSSGIFDNKNFKEIVSIGEKAVSVIYEKLLKEDTQLVYALDLILPGVVIYNGFVTLHDACETWRNLLSKYFKYNKL